MVCVHNNLYVVLWHLDWSRRYQRCTRDEDISSNLQLLLLQLNMAAPVDYNCTGYSMAALNGIIFLYHPRYGNNILTFNTDAILTSLDRIKKNRRTSLSSALPDVAAGTVIEELTVDRVFPLPEAPAKYPKFRIGDIEVRLTFVLLLLII